MLPDDVGGFGGGDELGFSAKEQLGFKAVFLLISFGVISESLGVAEGFSLTIVGFKGYKSTDWSRKLIIISWIFDKCS